MRTRFFVLLLLSAAWLWTGCGSSEDDGGSGQRGRYGGGGEGTTPSVEAVQARFGALPLEEQMSGTVRASDQVGIYPEIDAPVVSVPVENGDYVERGDVLVRLRADRFEEQLRQAESALKIARAGAKRARATLRELQSQLKRTERLAESQFESDQQLESLRARVQGAEADVEEAEARVEQAEATVDERQTDLRRTAIRAPFSGYVGNRNAEVGQRVGPSTELFTMGSLDTMTIEVQVTDKMFGQIKPGQTVRIQSPSLPDTVLTASVSRMSPFLSQESYSAEAEIDVPNPGRVLNAGMYVDVSVLYGESQQATLLPKSALYENPETGARGVYLAPSLGTEVQVDVPDEFDKDDPPPLTKPTPTRFQEVEVIAEGRQTVGVRGVSAGDWVVTVGQNLLSSGRGGAVDARVRPMPWNRLMALQELQDVDLLKRTLDRQQRIAKQQFGREDTTQSEPDAEPPSNVASDSDTTASTLGFTSQL